jgi:hypothetical protein
LKLRSTEHALRSAERDDNGELSATREARASGASKGQSESRLADWSCEERNTLHRSVRSNDNGEQSAIR